MDTREAELMFEAGKEAVVKALVEMHARTESLSQQVITLEKKIASLPTNSANSPKPPTSDGPRAHGAIGYLSSVHGIGRRGIVEILDTLFGLSLCVGTV